MDRYVMLRDGNAGLRRGLRRGAPMMGPEGFAARAAPAAPGLEVPPAPVVEAADLTPAEAASAARDPGVLELARAMPTRLIAPMPSQAPATGAGVATWGVARVGAADGPFTGAGVRVAVLDTGIDSGHPAFAGVDLRVRDFTGTGEGDGNGHGTHCAGTVFGRDVEGLRIGVAPGVTEALIGKVLGDDGAGTSDMLFDALRWCSSEGARVISMSLGFDFPGFAERLVEEGGFPVRLATSIALTEYRRNLRVFDGLMGMIRDQAAFDGGVVVCAASGNESERARGPEFEVSASLPAAAETVVSVGALAEGEGGLEVAPFSNTDPVLSAPGVDVISAAAGGGLVAFSGTSMACPHVAGCAALWWEALGARRVPLTVRAVEARLIASASTSGFAPGSDVADRGQGLVRAPSALVA